jgi:hypothetical protein
MLIIINGCSTTPYNYHAGESYQDREEIKTSLFSSDTSQLSNSAASKILDGKIRINKNSRVALLKVPDSSLGVRYYGYYYWRTEEYINLQQQYVTILSSSLLNTDKISNVVVFPSFLTSEKFTLPEVREAAVRMQANLLVIYKIQSDVFERFRLLRGTQIKAYASCEAAVLDTRTGIIPYTNVITEVVLTEKKPQDANMNETRKRAEIEASNQCLNAMGTSMAKYINEIP